MPKSSLYQEWREYFLFFADWGSLMSGAFTIPFTIAALFNVGTPQKAFVILAFLTLLWLCYGLIRRIRQLRRKRFDIAGMWKRADGLSNIIEQSGNKITSNFSRGPIDHRLEGFYDPRQEKFIIRTLRVDTQSGLRTAFHGVYALLDAETLVYINYSTDGEGFPLDYRESGILERFKGGPERAT